MSSQSNMDEEVTEVGASTFLFIIPQYFITVVEKKSVGLKYC